MIQMEQVQGNKVVIVDKSDDGKTIKNCDALIISDPDVELCVRVADCLPIFVTDDKGRYFGVIHAGWRGLSKGIISKTIEKMHNSLKIENCELIIAIGPHICKKHYEVKEDVSSKFSKYSKALLRKYDKTFLDLAEVAREQLVALGVKNKNITIDKTCTFENKNLHSFRRDKSRICNRYYLTTSS